MEGEKTAKEILEELTITLSEPITGSEIKLTGFNQILGFFEQQHDFWKENGHSIIVDYTRHFRECIDSLKDFSSSAESLEDHPRRQKWNSVVPVLQQTSAGDQRNTIVFADTSHASFLKELVRDEPGLFQAAYNYLIKKMISLRSLNDFRGSLMAYEFENPETLLVSRSNQEASVLADLKNTWRQRTTDMIKENEELKTGLEDWRETLQNQHQSWKDKRNRDIDVLVQAKTEALEALEILYREKLRLEGPVQYWQQSAQRFKTQGRAWMYSLVTTIVLLSVFLIIVLYRMPGVFSANPFTGDPGAIKGLIILASIISLGAYLAITFTRLTFSSIHLQRDSEEREQLTLLYLALIEKGSIEPEDRKLVLQSLFSRAETGLLKMDSAPTMPGIVGIIDKFVK